MGGERAYTDCELRYMDQGYDLKRAVATCARAEGRGPEEKKEESNKEELWQDDWGDF